MNTIGTYDKLKIKCRVKIVTLLRFKYETNSNGHIYANISGIVHKEDVWILIKNEIDAEKIGVFMEDENSGETSSIFQGMILSVNYTEEETTTFINIKAVSASWKLDKLRKRRSFQNVSITYKELLESIIHEYSDVYLLWNIIDKKIERPFIQYEETDWEFIKRILSHLYTIPYTDCIKNATEIYVGVIKDGQTKSDNVMNYKIHDNGSFFRKYGYKDSIDKQFYNSIKNTVKYNIGDKITINDKKMIVCQVNGEIENGILNFHYILGDDTLYSTIERGNQNIQGMTLHGTVLDREKESVKLHLNIDDKQEKQTAYFYPWRPITGNILYGMPEIGEQVALYIQDDNEQNGICIYGIRSNNENCEDLKDPSRKLFTTSENKRLYLNPGETGVEVLQTGKKSLAMNMSDLTGITVKSNNKISLMAEQQLTLRGKVVSFLAPKEITLVRKDLLAPTVINLCNAFDSVGITGGFKTNLIDTVPDKKVDVNSRRACYEIEEAIVPIICSIPCTLSGDEATDKVIAGLPLF